MKSKVLKYQSTDATGYFFHFFLISSTTHTPLLTSCWVLPPDHYLHTDFWYSTLQYNSSMLIMMQKEWRGKFSKLHSGFPNYFHQSVQEKKYSASNAYESQNEKGIKIKKWDYATTIVKNFLASYQYKTSPFHILVYNFGLFGWSHSSASS